MKALSRLMNAQNRIGKRLIVMIVAFSTLITLCITVLQLFLDYRDLRRDLNVTLEGVTVYVPSITSSVWAFDEEQIALSLEGLNTLKNVEAVKIVTSDNKKSWSTGAIASKRVVQRNYTLLYKKREDVIDIGTLQVTASLDSIYERVLAKAIGILVSNGIKAFLVAGFMFAIFYKYVTRRIEDLAQQVARLSLDLTDSDLQALKNKNPALDEIELVQEGFDQMASKLRATMRDLGSTNNSLHHALEEVQTINTDLETRVENRTDHLQKEIHERRQAENSLKESETRFRDIAEAASDWFWETDVNNRFVYLSKRCFDVTGMTPDDVIGKDRAQLISTPWTEQEIQEWKNYEKIIAAHQPLNHFRYRLNTPQGQTFYIELNGRAAYDTHGEFTGYRGAARDITDQVQYQRMLESAKEASDQANRAKSEFISNISHEFRTPLNGILGFAQLLEMNKKQTLSDQDKVYVKQIVTAGNHLLSLINDVLDLAKVEAGKLQVSLENVSPVQVINNDLDLIKALAQHSDIQVNFDHSDVADTIKIYVDQTRLRQIIMNLVSNAIKYNSKAGSVYIGIQTTPENMVRISVKDTGAGLNQDQIGQLFKPFNRLHAEFSNTEGTGVGLAITQNLVELMGGKIGVESKPNEGCLFWFEFARVSDDTHKENARTTQQTVREEGPLKACRVLYIEDNEENMALINEVFQNFGNAELVGAKDGESGLEIAAHSDFDIVLVDINLPVMDGFEVVQTLRKTDTYKDKPILALSANVHANTIKRSKESGFNDFLSKPINIAQLIQTLNTFLPK